MRCGQCRQDNPPGAKFCSECGTRLDATPVTYTPGHLARRITNVRTALPGERKQVTVLFADLKGSLELLAGRDPEDARALLDAVLERLMEAVHRFEGTVNQVMGDGIMALFGAPVAHEDHAVRACYAALQIHKMVARDSEALRRRDGIDVQIRVGLNSGEVVVRSIGSDLQMDYTAVGQTTHLAARMEQLARAGTTLITAATWRLAARYMEAEPYGPVPIKGLKDPVEVYELRRATPVQSQLHATSARGVSRMLGRSAELATLQEAALRTALGRGQVVTIAGDPGIGKSRLLWEFAHSPATQGWRALEANGVSYGAATPYLPLRELLTAYFEIDDADEPRRVREKVTGTLVALDPGLAPAAAAVLAIGNLPTEDPAWEALLPVEVRQRIFKAVKDLLLAESRRQPLLLVFENLHWFDSETESLLDSLMAGTAEAAVLIVITSRPEYRHEWPEGAPVTALRLDPLTRETAQALLDGLLGGDPALQPLKTRLIAHTDGNPFFLEESVQALVETGVLTGVRGDHHLGVPDAAIRIADRVQSVVAARIDRLPPAGKHLLQTAAVIGLDVPVALLEAVSTLPAAELAPELVALEDAGFLRTSRLFPDIAYSFKHALTQDVAYGGLLKDHRRALHAAVVTALESLAFERLAEQVERLAFHATRAERWAQAVTYLREAAEHASARSANKEAVAFFEEALGALQHLPETAETLALAIDLRLDMRPALLQLGRLDAIVALSKDAETVAERLGDEARLARVYSYLINYHYLRGEQETAMEYGTRCLAMAERTGDRGLATLVRRYVGHSLHARGESARAAEVFGTLAGTEIETSTTSTVAAWAWRAFALADLGDFDGADAAADRARAVAEMSRHPYSEAIAWSLTGLVWAARGQFERAVPALTRAVTICRDAGLAVWQPIPSSVLGLCLARLKRADDGLPLLEEAVRQSDDLGVRAYVARWTAHLGEALLLAGHPRRAAGAAERAIELAMRHGERGNEAEARLLRGALAARPEALDVATAVEEYEHALTIAERLDMRPLQARAHLALGRLHRLVHHNEQAEDHIARAIVLFSGMGMRSWLEQAEPELRALGHLIIVGRSNVDLYDYLVEKFAGDRNVRIILDRRQGKRRRAAPAEGADPRATERRRQAIDDRIRTRGLAILLQG
ncbi:MAG TPA: adenylate/guanylate cyclase domain-containing protein [Candidatus Limnocylindria bacterium]|nr:adenylate/guanylate cyclase domain-containing protein [Candidatus Limnocylindria bacterium]